MALVHGTSVVIATSNFDFQCLGAFLFLKGNTSLPEQLDIRVTSNWGISFNFITNISLRKLIYTANVQM